MKALENFKKNFKNFVGNPSENFIEKKNIFCSKNIFARYSLKYLLSFSVILAVVTSCAPKNIKADGAHHIVFLHLNDSHGHFYGKLDNEQRPQDGYVLENLAGYVAAIEEEAGVTAVILSHGGDLNTGTPESAMLKAKPDYTLFGLSKMRVATIGNHEFDIPLHEFQEQIKHSPFPWVSANVVKKDGQYLTNPYAVIKAGNLNIGFIGLTTEQTSKIGNPQFIADVKFLPAVDKAQQYIDSLKSKTDFTIALTHLGLYAKDNVPHKASDDRVLAENTQGLDLILGGHSHTLVKGEVVNNVPIFQAKCFSEHLIRVDYVIYPRNVDGSSRAKLLSHQVISLQQPPHKISAKAQKIRQTAKQLTDSFLAQSQKLFSQVVGYANEEFHYQREHIIGSAISRLVAQSHHRISKADLALTIVGGVRSGLKKGPITLRDVLTVAPFNNTIGIVELSGKELADLLQDKIFSADRGAYPATAGISVEIQGKKIIVKKDNKFLDLNKKYKVAINSYMAAGGSGYPDYISAGRFVDLGVSDADMLRQYIEQLKSIDYNTVKVE